MSDEREHESEGPAPREVYLTVPNVISALRILSIPFIALLIARHHMLAALIVLAISALSDALDGMIARSFDQVSHVGQFLDPIADRLLIFCSVLALGVAHIIPWWVLIVVAARDVLLGVLTLVLAQYDFGPLPVHFVGKAGTALLLIAIVSLILSDVSTAPAFGLLHLAAIAIGIWGVALYWVAGVIYLNQGLRLLGGEYD